MSTLKVNKIENTASTDGGIEIDSDGHVQLDGVQLPTAGALSNRNLIINGAMTVCQRSTSNTGQASSAYGTDRYRVMISSLGTWTIEQSTDAPSGFSNSLKLDCTAADSSPTGGNYLFIRYIAEARDLQLLGYGTSDAKPLTMSFWVKSNKTGDASFMLNSPDGSDRAFITTYNIAAADTWEHKTIPIPADTGGTINNDNGSGFEIEWWFNSGSTFTGTTPDSGWASRVNAARNNSNLGVGGAVDDYIQITGVQLEVGDKATPFEHRTYGDELTRCLRYYYKADCEGSAKHGMMGMSYSGDNYYIPFQFPVPMRAAPSVQTEGGGNWRSRTNNTNSFDVTWSTHGNTSTTQCTLQTSGGSIAAATPFWFETHDASGCNLEISAEL